MTASQIFRRLARAGTLAAAIGAASAPAPAAEFYSGKTINFVLGFDVGNGFDAYARAIGRHLAQHIPGAPTLVLQNMPGAGSNIAAAYLFAAAPKDGTTIGALLPDALLAKLMGDKTAASFDPNLYQYLAGAERGTRLCVTSASSKIKTYEDALANKVMIGATAPGGPTYDYAMWHKNTTGAEFNIVSGYKGTADLYLASDRGEIDGMCGVDWTALKTQRASFLRDHKLNLLVQDGIEPEPELAALGVPQTWQFIKQPEDRRAVELIVGFQQAVGKAYLLPPGVPPQAVAILRAAFAATLQDLDFLADAGKIGIPIRLTRGEQLQRTVQDAYATPPEVVARMKAILEH